MTTVYSLLFWSYLGLSSVPFFLGAVAIKVLTYPFDRRGRLLHLYTCFWAAQYTYVNPLWKVTVEGRRNGTAATPCVFVCNHQSIADIVVLFCTYLPFKWLSKESMFRAPLIGWNMWLNGYVPLRRGDKDSIVVAQAKARRWIERGMSMMYFPEGTRSKDGEIQPFKHGAFTLALETGRPIVPIVLDGTRACVPKHSWRLEGKARVTIRVLPAIDSVPYRASGPEAMAEAVRALMKDELESLRRTRAQAA